MTDRAEHALVPAPNPEKAAETEAAENMRADFIYCQVKNW